MEQVILVDANDRELGTMEKIEAHKKGVLHRAFSVLLFNSHGEMLLQKRVDNKYHTGGLWTNTCCSHPRPNEAVTDAAERRLKEEMGIELRPQFLYKFIYKITLDNQLIEHEYDHVFIGHWDGEPQMNPIEAQDWQYVGMETLRENITQQPETFTPWFKIIMENIGIHLKKKV